MTEQERQELLVHIRNNYVYDVDTGRIRHKARDRPQEGSIEKNRPYRRLGFVINRKTFAVDEHICVWILYYGRWPKETIDHIDGNHLNNHIENLRVCSMSDNRLNMELPWKPNPKTGLPGVCEHGNKYRNRIRGHIIAFDNAYEAFFWGFMHGKRYLPD